LKLQLQLLESLLWVWLLESLAQGLLSVQSPQPGLQQAPLLQVGPVLQMDLLLQAAAIGHGHHVCGCPLVPWSLVPLQGQQSLRSPEAVQLPAAARLLGQALEQELVLELLLLLPQPSELRQPSESSPLLYRGFCFLLALLTLAALPLHCQTCRDHHFLVLILSPSCPCSFEYLEVPLALLHQLQHLRPLHRCYGGLLVVPLLLPWLPVPPLL
jgi:hypothetical protein